MVKKDIKGPEQDLLVVTKDEAKAKLQKQIEEGEEIAKLPLNNDAAVKQAKDKLESWYDFTKEVLLRTFSTDKMEQEFSLAVRVSTIDPLHDFHYAIERYLPTLKSILRRVDLYNDIVPKEATQITVAHGSLNKKRVFVVHGRNKQLTDSMFSFLDAIGLEPLEWNEVIAMTGKPSPTVPEIVSTAFKEAQAIVVLLSGDDLAVLRKEFIHEYDEAYEKDVTPQARPNVLFEAGQAMAASQERTVLVQVGKIRKFSDIQGLHITHLDNSTQKRQELITKLRNAHCDIRDISAENRWMEVGNFEDKVDLSITSKEFQKENSASEADDPFAKIKRTKIVRTKEGIPESLTRLKNGQELTSLLEGCYAGSFYNDNPSTQLEVDLISRFFQSVQDFMDSLPDIAPSRRVQYEYDLTTTIDELEDEGFLVYGGIEIRRIEDGISSPEPFHVAIIKVQRRR
jgi:predicted nucleotide-binding protein